MAGSPALAVSTGRKSSAKLPSCMKAKQPVALQGGKAPIFHFFTFCSSRGEFPLEGKVVVTLGTALGKY